MKPLFIRSSAILVWLVVGIGQTGAEEYLSNLKNLFGDPPSPDIIGDIEVLNYWYGPFVVQFFTGSGLDEGRSAKIFTRRPAATATNFATIEHFELNSVTVEFLGSPASPWTNISMTVEVYQHLGDQKILLGELGNDTVNPTPTQWPHSTTFIDFHPLTNIVLEPLSEYSVELSEPYNFPDVFGLLFTYSPDYVTSADWRMGKTTWHVPISDVEYLKLAIGATAVVGTNSTSGLGTNSSGVAVSNVRLSAKRDGSNIVLSWPTSTAPSQLYVSSSFESGAWTPVSTQPVIINDNFVVTLQISGSGYYFRLQAQ
jgi:hypothetical protein